MNTGRLDLIAMLSDAAEVEHSVCCAYQFAAYSLKTHPNEGAVDWAGVEAAREWKTTLLLMARQEMEHLGGVADLLTAVGAAPHFGRPDFPYVNPYLGGDLFELQRFNLPMLERFICLERPAHISSADAFCGGARSLSARAAAAGTVGALYEKIRTLFSRLPHRELLIGDPSQQISNVTLGLPAAGFYDVRNPPITSRAAALKLLDQIIDEGEGTTAGRKNREELDRCHFGRLLEMRRQYLAHAARAKKSRRRFDPVRRVVSNPAAFLSEGHNDVTLITHEPTREVMRIFDFGYQTLLMFLIRVYSHRIDSQRGFKADRAAAFWPLMTLFVRPIGELLTMLPATDARDGPKAGPGFRLSPVVHLLPDPTAAAIVLHERLVRLADDASRLAGRRWLPSPWRHRIHWLGRDLQRLAWNFAREAHVE